MNKLKELINKLCPNGVEHKKLGELIIIEKGKQLNKTLLSSNGKYPVINGGIMPSGYWNEYNYTENLITISQGGASAGYVNFIDTKFWAGAHCYVIVKVDSKINYRYVYHFLKSKENELQNSQVGAGIPSVSLKDINNLYIAVPPLEVQCEIVHILDDFTLLSAELSAELKARQKQYEYYRDKLLTFEEAENLHGYFYRQEIKWLKLQELCKSIKDGMHNLPKNTLDKSMYPILSAQNIFNGEINFDAKRYVDEETYIKENKRTNIEKGDVLLTIVATIGRIAVVKEKNKFLLQRSVCVLKPNELVNPYYLKFYLETYKIQNYMITNAHGSAQSGLYLNQVAEIIVPIPSMDIQNKIVTILTDFYKITHDISEGLPAEIEARQKQYEYYRDKLLTFKELKVNE